MGRLIFAPIAIAIASIYAASLVPGAEWKATHSFGLGGLFGDTVMGALLTVLPIGSHVALKLLSLLAALLMLASAAYVLGFTKAELVRGARLLMIGVVSLTAACGPARMVTAPLFFNSPANSKRSGRPLRAVKPITGG